MRKLIACIAIAAALAAAFAIGNEAGKRDAVQNSEYWILEFDEPENADLYLHVLLGGKWYLRECYIG